MADQPNPADFSADDRPNQYTATFTVRGEIFLTIEATSPEEARAKAQNMLADEDFGCELDEVSSVAVDQVRKSPPMFRVLREGSAMQVSHLQVGDQPRQPDARGF